MPVIETERFFVHRDTYFPDKWLIRPFHMTALWLVIFGVDWDIEFYGDDAHHFGLFYERLINAWERQAKETGDDAFVCEIEVEYWFTPPPELRSLRYGKYVGASREEFWSIVGGGDHPRKVVGGFVRAIRVVPLSERDHHGRDQGQEPTREREVRVL